MRKTHSRRSAATRKFVWVRSTRNFTALTQGPTNFFNFDPLDTFESAVGITRMPGVTITRIRGGISLGSSAALPAGSAPIATLGIRVRNQSEAAPVANLGPQSDVLADWMLYENILPATTATPTPVAQGALFDSHAMRRLEGAQDGLLGMLQFNAFGATGSFNGTIVLSIGVKLP